MIGTRALLILGVVLLCGFPVLAQEQQNPAAGTGAAVAQADSQELPGTVRGTIVDGTGAAVAGARVSLAHGEQSGGQEAVAGEDGQFTLNEVAPGPFQLTIAAEGFRTQTSAGLLHSGENDVVAPIVLMLAAAETKVEVTLTERALAEAEIKDEEKQRILGVIPNFYVTYNPHAVPLDTKQKFELAWKATIDPVNFGVTGAVAGIEQATNAYSGYGQGAEGYGKRYGANYADFLTSTFIGSALLPSLLKQDPRYFYKGTGSVRARLMYAMASAVICKGDNGRWQANYSAIAGSLAAGGISNLYYPTTNRNGVSLTFENALIGIGSSALANTIQEFLIKKVTPHAPSYAPAKP
jgi:hypothetical protein